MEIELGTLPETALRERRCEWRYSAGEAEALVSNPAVAEVFSGKILDLSKTGIGLLLSECIPLGGSIEIFLKTTVILGEVRNCTLLENREYRVGVRILSIAQRPGISAQ